MRQGRLIPLLLFLAIASGSSGAQVLAEQEMSKAVAMGSNCEAPIMKIAGQRDFDIYLETPLARAALVVATARMMHQRLDAPNVTTAMREVYTMWLDATRDRWKRLSFHTIRVWSRGVEIRPTVVRDARLFLGTVPSHGIIEPLRARHPEFVFESLPVTGFEVVVYGNGWSETHQVGDLRRANAIRVCN